MSNTVDLVGIETRARAAIASMGSKDPVAVFNHDKDLIAHISGLDPPTTLALVATIRALEAERDAMREALRPFGDWAKDYRPDAEEDWDDNPYLTSDAKSASVDDLRRAAALVHPMAETER